MNQSPVCIDPFIKLKSCSVPEKLIDNFLYLFECWNASAHL